MLTIFEQAASSANDYFPGYQSSRRFPELDARSAGKFPADPHWMPRFRQAEGRHLRNPAERDPLFGDLPFRDTAGKSRKRQRSDEAVYQRQNNSDFPNHLRSESHEHDASKRFRNEQKESFFRLKPEASYHETKDGWDSDEFDDSLHGGMYLGKETPTRRDMILSPPRRELRAGGCSPSFPEPHTDRVHGTRSLDRARLNHDTRLLNKAPLGRDSRSDDRAQAEEVVIEPIRVSTSPILSPPLRHNPSSIGYLFLCVNNVQRSAGGSVSTGHVQACSTAI